MRNIERRSIKTGADDAGINTLLADTRLDERRCRAVTHSARLDSLAAHIYSRQLGYVEAAELLRQEAENMNNQAQELS
ncbi:DUF2732 family protein [Erwinia sp. E602]|uniref:DUF2732 family protein n=1 Tax=Erwinia sp. E602 TaxID=2675378 RepID=UPI001BA64318|nr:DUF2732 family protein [Erwinia sp. E602]QUG76357.1 DUF2732 family protein [Erwinia sp. E602]